MSSQGQDPDRGALGRDARARRLIERVARLSSSRFDPVGLSAAVLEALAPELGIDGAAVYLIEGDELVLAASFPPGATVPSGAARLPISTVNAQVLAGTGATQWTSAEAGSPRQRAIIAETGCSQFASAPLQAAGGHLGLLHIARIAERRFEPEELALLGCVAAQLGPGLDCALRLAGRDTEVGPSTRELSILQRTAIIVGRSLDLAVVLEACVSLFEELMGADACSIYIDHGDEAHIRLASHHAGPGVVVPVYDSIPRTALARYAEANPRPFIDAVENVREPYRSELARAGVVLTVTLPLVAEGALVGLASMGFRSPRRFSPSTLNTLLALGEQQAIAIDRARTHALAEMRARLSNMVRKVAERALGAGTSEETYDALLDGTSELTGTEAARLALFDEEGALDTVRGRALSPNHQWLRPVAWDDSSVRWLRALGGPCEVHSADEFPPDSSFRRLFELASACSLLVVPLRSRGRLLGMLTSPSTLPRRFHPEQKSAFDLLASVAASAVEGERLRRQADQERRRLGQIIESLPMPVMVIDARGRIEQSNASVRSLNAEAVVGAGWQSAVEQLGAVPGTEPIGGRGLWLDEHVIARALRGEDPAPAEVRVLAGRGWRSMIVHAVALCDEAGRVTGVVSAWQDVTALRELADAKDRFLAMASHELRAPLGNLHAVTSQLRLDPRVLADDARRQDLARRIIRQVDRMARLVGDLHDVERLRDGTLRLNPERLELGDVAREVVELVAEKSGARPEPQGGVPGASRVRVEAQGRVAGQWDRVRIAQVVENLVSNAVRYSPDEGEIVITVAGDGQHAWLSVMDHGIGIPPAQLRRLFEPGFRGAEAGKLVPGGLGLGLYITQEIVRRHGGRIEVQSETGRGSTFTVILPCEPPPKAVALSSAATVIAPSTSGPPVDAGASGDSGGEPGPHSSDGS